MTKEEILYCLKADSVGYAESCNKCVYGDKEDVGTCYSKHLLAAIKELEQELCEDTVSRKDVVKFLWNHAKDFVDAKYRMAYMSASSLIENPNNIPPATPQPKKGQWFIDERPESDREVICSNCDQPIFKYHKLDFDYRPNYCPNCGAKMGGRRMTKDEVVNIDRTNAYTKNEVITILTEIQTEIENTVKEEELIDKNWARGLHYSEKIIQQKVNELEKNKDKE